jgi:hypothetical protein
LQALVLEAEEGAKDSVLSDTNFYEVTIASVDQPKLLSRLSEALVSTSWDCSRLAHALTWLKLQQHLFCMAEVVICMRRVI